ncbi:hypothetical protein FRC06_001156 [Ceratobasidium sp. 370]|nr:hypothetical protein FRC06_001156 [Ceratobasidium sp. 370]
MQPALNPDGPHQRDMVWVDRWSILARRKYRRGDIVSLRSPLDPNLIIVKRILALGGDITHYLPTRINRYEYQTDMPGLKATNLFEVATAITLEL